MPAPEDRMPDRCEPLAYPEAVRLTNPIEPSLCGEVRTISHHPLMHLNIIILCFHTQKKASGCNPVASTSTYVNLRNCVSVWTWQVDDKYEYATDNRDNRVQGWMGSNPMVGFWVITASDEFRNGGPLKQNLTSHVGPTCLSVSDAFSPNHAYGSWSL
jgi:rhamnogalacturonan endolyase